MSRPCPLCREGLRGNWEGPLYGLFVCETCRRSFARRRQWAYVVDFLMLVLFQQCLKAVDYWAGPPRLLVEAAGLLSLVAFVSKDGIGGASPGKRLFDLEVVDRETRETAGFWASILRNLPTLLMPVALFAAAEVKSGRRLGEGWAGTMVIWRRYRYEPPFRGVRPICHACGYDLRGNESGRCPECGLEHEFGFVEPAMGKKVD